MCTDSVPSNLYVRSYTRSFNGFAANLTKQEQRKLAVIYEVLTKYAARDDVVSIFPCKRLQLHTTSSWDFIGFPQKCPSKSCKSFDDHGFGPIPNKWKRACNGGDDFMCNKRTFTTMVQRFGRVGAITQNHWSSLLCIRFAKRFRRSEGHGTHISSTAAGNNVMDVSYCGIVEGTARGEAPAARTAVYKAYVFTY
ncbi:unnamed protein product [Coffea canephora]|uniref:Inhibitor I9 domain-containing protein n=1 Tax=Coffea canephora TaxID=49390 RepID=A0A068V6J8_COFCA|nr:unnamed protein product [Coffea canephora]